MKKFIQKVKIAIEKLKIAWGEYKTELTLIDWADVTIRALKTFVQVAITYAATALTGINFAKELSGAFWLGFMLSAGSAGVSAAWNSVLMPVLNPNKAKSSLDDYMLKMAIDKAKLSSNAQPTKDDSNG